MLIKRFAAQIQSCFDYKLKSSITFEEMKLSATYFLDIYIVLVDKQTVILLSSLGRFHRYKHQLWRPLSPDIEMT